MTYAFTSLDETEDRLRDGLARGHWTTEQLDAAWRLIRRITPALRNFRSYLLTDEARRRSRNVYSAKRRRPGSTSSDA